MRLGIIGAMSEELSFLHRVIKINNKEVIAGLEFIVGNIHGMQVVIVCSGIGKVNISFATSILLTIYEPDLLINIGSAGALDKSLQIGEIIVANEVAYFDVDVTAFGYELGQVPQEPVRFACNNKLVNIFLNSVKNNKCQNSAESGLIITGDEFVNKDTRKSFLRTKFPDVKAVEMEAASVAHVAHKFNTEFLIIKIISDVSNEEAEKNFKNNLVAVTENLAKLVSEFIQILE